MAQKHMYDASGRRIVSQLPLKAIEPVEDDQSDVPQRPQQVSAGVQLAARRQALSHISTTATALNALSTALKEAGAPGLVWDADYIAGEVHALTDAIAALVEAERTSQTDQGEASHLRAD